MINSNFGRLQHILIWFLTVLHCCIWSKIKFRYKSVV